MKNSYLAGSAPKARFWSFSTAISGRGHHEGRTLAYIFIIQMITIG